MRVSSRLKKAAELVPKGLTVRDIGADHGFLSLELAGKGNKVYAVENKKGPYQRLAETLKWDKTGKTFPLFQDGISFLPEDVQGLILLGRGGNTIASILKEKEAELKKRKFILIEPQSDFRIPIFYLLRLGLVNDDGCYVFEKRYYPLLRFVPGEKKEYSSDELEYGPYPIRNKDQVLLKHIEGKIYLLEHVQKEKKVDCSDKISELEKVKRKLRRKDHGER